MKPKHRASPPAQGQRPAVGLQAAPPVSAVIRESVVLPGAGLSVSVRTAKARLSALLELVAGGREVTITSDGKPKALLVPVGSRQPSRVFTGTWEQIKQMPLQKEGPFAEEIIRADRDGRGW